MSGEPEPDAPQLLLDRPLITRAVVGVVLITVLAGIVGVAFKAPLQTAGAVFLDLFGLPGLFAAVVFTDGVPFPLTNEPLIFLARGAGVGAWVIFWVVSAGSVTAGAVGYWGGRLLGRSLGLEAWLERRQPALVHTMREYGAEGVAIAAVLPIPFQLSTWSAGTLRVPFGRVMLASLLRLLKTGFYVLVIVGGLSLGD